MIIVEYNKDFDGFDVTHHNNGDIEIKTKNKTVAQLNQDLMDQNYTSVMDEEEIMKVLYRAYKS